MTVYVPSLLEKDPKKTILAVQQLAAGRSNAFGVFTLATSAASTTVADQNCAAGSVIIPVPATANASAEVAGGAFYIPVATILNGSFVIQHKNSTTTARTFTYAIHG